jgi:hypothetical protein
VSLQCVERKVVERVCVDRVEEFAVLDTEVIEGVGVIAHLGDEQRVQAGFLFGHVRLEHSDQAASRFDVDRSVVSRRVRECLGEPEDGFVLSGELGDRREGAASAVVTHGSPRVGSSVVE